MQRVGSSSFPMPKNLRRVIRDSQSCEPQNQREECPTLARTKPARVGHPPESTCHEAASLGSLPAHQGLAHPLGWVRSSRWQDTTLESDYGMIKVEKWVAYPLRLMQRVGSSSFSYA